MPDLPAGYLDPLPALRPVGLRRRRIPSGTERWRIDASEPGGWSWAGFADPRQRFDPASGAFRVRYAGHSLQGAARERYRDTGLFVPADHAAHYVVRITAVRDLRVLDVRTEANLDVLRIDDRISTGQHPEVWDTCQRLADAVRDWWDDLDGIVYRSRTTPATSSNLAFFSSEPLGFAAWTLADRPDVLSDLALHDGFTVAWDLAA